MLTSSQLVSSHQTVWSLNWFYRQSFNQKLVDTCLEWKYKLIDSIIDERLYNLLWQYDNHDFSNPRDKNEQLNNRLSAIIGRILYSFRVIINTLYLLKILMQCKLYIVYD